MKGSVVTVTNYKKCAQCGCVLPEDAYKIKYVSKKSGKISRNRFCRNCEEDTRQYNQLTNVSSLEELNHDDQKKLEAFIHAFTALERQGLSTPLSRNAIVKTAAHVAIFERLSILQEQGIIEKTEEPVTTTVPASNGYTTEVLPVDLRKWLSEPASEILFIEWYEKQHFTAEYLNNVVYPTLKAAYRPEIGWNDETMAPLYDDTYKSALNDISNLFWAYEDWCFAKTVEGGEDK